MVTVNAGPVHLGRFGRTRTPGKFATPPPAAGAWTPTAGAPTTSQPSAPSSVRAFSQSAAGSTFRRATTLYSHLARGPSLRAGAAGDGDPRSQPSPRAPPTRPAVTAYRIRHLPPNDELTSRGGSESLNL